MQHKPMKSILIVDDEEDLLDLLEYCFRQNGYQTFTAENVERALQVLAEQKVDVVLSDVCMPEENGVDLLRAVKEKKYDVSFIFFSGFSTISEEEALELGSLGMLKKPMKFEELAEKVTFLAGENRKTAADGSDDDDDGENAA